MNHNVQELFQIMDGSSDDILLDFSESEVDSCIK